MNAARLRTAGWHLFVLLLLTPLLYPIVWLAAASFKPGSEVLEQSLSLLPSHFVFDNYRELGGELAGVPVWRFFANSILVAGGSALANVLSCSLAAYAFARLRFRLRGPLFAFMLATIMLPAHAVLIPQYTIFQRLGMVDTFWPLILPKLLATDAFFIFLMVQFMRNIPRELDEAARLDGCGSIRIFGAVILPLVRPALVTTAIFTFIWTWNDFLSQLIYLSDPEKYTLPLALRLFIDTTDQASYGPMLALSALALVPILLFFAAFQRLLVEGFATSGLKG
ncbi:carbohydrate ABC transporter permease [Actinoplanes regularis]|uniref:Multiple sugar transport system permease protein n=1 Tax=Actinoplanes regularis TaxID=52697 RepID=A0A238W4X0_9ACTN|nr:carbohydrate ABC transporter permease [Actinoplanes regularis]GIE85249.1 sugar ABC transporter permease [Actinoplanes regularis]GLW27438.1 sugar ABC transporter permease [Actinoplanes regularis]SNR41655.1 multiple sugar transport system permease protein [Actinoplanes regularis]